METQFQYLKGNVAEVELSYKSNVKPSERYQIKTSGDAYRLFSALYGDGVIEHHEQMIILCLNKANKVLGYSLISSGGISGTVVDPKIIFQIALKINACSIIISHNHPSGETIPSEADKRITKMIRDAGTMLEIILLDHIIATSEQYYSFADDGMI
jgi:DNA repair protein RadC